MISNFVDENNKKLDVNDVVEFKGQTFLIIDIDTLKSLEEGNDMTYGRTDYPLVRISTYDEYLNKKIKD